MKEIEYFYAAHSAFAYLGSKKLMSIANAAKCKIIHKPVDLNRCVAAGGASPFEARSQAHVDYYFGTEINRWSAYRNAPVLGFIPTHHNNDPSMANGMLIAGLQQGQNIDALAHALLEEHWRDDADLADRETLARRLPARRSADRALGSDRLCERGMCSPRGSVHSHRPTPGQYG